MNIENFFGTFIKNIKGSAVERMGAFNLFFSIINDLSDEEIDILIEKGIIKDLFKKELKTIKDFEMKLTHTADFVPRIFPSLPERVREHILKDVMPSHLEELNTRTLKALLNNYLTRYLESKHKDDLYKYMVNFSKSIFTVIDIDYIVSQDKYKKLKKEIMKVILSNN